MYDLNKIDVLQLTNSFDFVIIDKEDKERLSKYTWRIGERGKVVERMTTQYSKTLHIPLANEVMNDLGDYSMFDHKDRNYLVNTKENLRYTDWSLNNHNRKKLEGTSSKYRGVSYDSSRNRKKRWAVKPRGKDGKSIYLGRFETEEEAARVADKFFKEKYGEDAFLNFPEQNLEKLG